MENSKIKKSVVASAFVSTAGLFISKVIGLAYSIPFSYILASDAYLSIYGTAFQIYNYLLNICTAGFPFAISTLVAKYTVLNNSKTILMIKRMSLRFLSLIGAAGMLLLILLSFFISPLMTEAQYAGVMRNSLIILSLALFLVPILSAYRGIVQGRKEMTEYAFSQTFEQIFRVGFLLSAAFIIVFVLKIDRVWALYCAILSTSVAAAAAIAQVISFDRKMMAPIKRDAKKQQVKAVSSRKLFKEFFAISIPYLMVSVLGYSDAIFNSVFLPIGLNLSSYTEAQTNTVIAAVNFVGTKLTAIPMILSPGFAAALIPHISSALETKDYKLVRKNVVDCLNIVLYIAVPVSFCIFAYAEPVCNTLFYTDNLQLSAEVTRWIALEGLLGTLTPMCVNLMMALRLRSSIIKKLFICTLIKGITIIPFTAWFGIAGTVISSSLGNLYIIISSLAEIEKVYKIKMNGLFHKLIFIAISTLCLWISCSALNVLGLDGTSASKMMSFIQMAGNGLISVVVYFGISVLLQLPQSIFHFKL